MYIFRQDIFVDLQYDKFVNQSNTDDGQKLWQDIKVALRKQIEEKPISLSGFLKIRFLSAVVCRKTWSLAYYLTLAIHNDYDTA